MRTIHIVAPDKAWAEAFEDLAGVYRKQLAQFGVTVEHVGSTSVPGLWAKPILDIDLVYREPGKKEEIIAEVEALGYVCEGELGIVGRTAFSRPDPEVPIGGGPWMDHHLYLVLEGSLPLANHRALREYLLAHPDEVEAYSRLKRELAQKYPHDAGRYTEAKTPFLTGILKRAGLDQAELDRITTENLNEKETE